MSAAMFNPGKERGFKERTPGLSSRAFALDAKGFLLDGATPSRRR